MEIVNILPLGVAEGVQNYSDADVTLINNSFITPTFGAVGDYIETYIRDLNGSIVGISYLNNNYRPGQGVTATGGVYSAIQLDPVQDAKNQGIDRGTVTLKYNFFRPLLNSNVENQFWIKEISPSRTEIKVARQDLSNTDVLNAFNNFNTRAGTLNYYPDFLLNFGLDVQLIAVNAVFVQENDQAFIIFKLYEPLPLEYGVKTQFWVVDKIAESVEYEVSIEIEAEQVVSENVLRGPNYKVAINQKQSQTTPYYNHNSLLATSVSSSYQQLQSWLEDKAISINVDYSNFDNFIHFSSATERLLNFKYKVELIEQYKAEIAAGNALSNTPGSIVVTSNNVLQQNIDNIINKFDPYEYYLYFESASTAWPKSTSLPPYELYSVTSSQVIDWLGSADTPPSNTGLSILYSASLFDSLNKDNLEYSMPSYIREDEANEPYNVFLNMIGQHFDNIWLYYKDVSNRYVATNNPDTGISLDLVADALRGFGIELYTNSNISDNIYYSMFGLNDIGSTLPLTSSQYAQLNLASSSLTPLAGEDYLSASIYLPPFGNEKLNKYVTPFITPFTGVTASFDTIAPRELEKEIYKRIYHNLPYLLKTKGTQRGIKALIACYGIPNSILTVNEFGANSIYAEPGIQQIQNQKVFTGSLAELSSSVLTPTTTLQYYDNNIERGSIDVEVGFSPADSINSHITGTLGNFNIMQYIGAPALQYSSSYTPLTNLSNNYFRTYYPNRYNVWDFIRLIKFYNNSLFKSIKDYVPSRASITSGIIIKSHILERNKYARHEPVITTHDHYSQSIELLTLSGSDAPTITTSTAYTGSIMTLSGSVAVNNNYHFEPYTGEYSGSTIKATTEYFAQTDVSSITQPYTSSVQGTDEIFTTYPLNYLYNNVSGAVLSQRFLNLDYSSNPYFPVNYGIVTKSLDLGRAAIGDQYAPYAELQDYNYSIHRSILPRYSGSKSTSFTYNTYTGAGTASQWGGDRSYGLNPAIDYNSFKLGWVKTIPTASLNFFEKTTINIKYLVDSEANVTELSANNDNLVEVQNTFKSGNPVKVSITDIQQPSNQVTLNGLQTIFRGGYRYDPIIYREGNEALNFTLAEPIEVENELDYIGVNAVDRHIYSYEMELPNAIINNQGVGRREPTGLTRERQPYGIVYAYSVDGVIQGQENYPMANPNAQYNYSTWINKLQASGLAQSAPINFEGPAYNVQQTAYVYAFDLTRFDTINRISEIAEDAYSTTEPYQYKVPRQGNYTINVKQKFAMQTYVKIPFRNQNGAILGYNTLPWAYKVVAVVEVNESEQLGEESQWFIRAVSTLNPLTLTNTISADPSKNLVQGPLAERALYPADEEPTNFELNLNATGIALNQGDYVRIRLYLMDLTNMFSYANNMGVNSYIKFQIGGNGFAGGFINDNQRPSLEIYDEATAATLLTYNATYDNTIAPFLYSSSLETNVLYLSTAVNKFLTTQSIFQPSSSTELFYSNVIDPFGIQTGDLIRIGKFKGPIVQYYTVKDFGPDIRFADFTPTGTFFALRGLTTDDGGVVRQPISAFTFQSPNIPPILAGDKIVITDALDNRNNITTTVTRVDYALLNSLWTLYFPATGLFPSVVADSRLQTITINLVPDDNTRYKITLLEDIPSTAVISGADFAFLRPKPDETSVIINYKKQPGVVSQTLLIPENASKQLTNSIGNIYKRINTDLQ